MRSLGYVKSLNSFSDSSLKLMSINLQSIISKKEVFWELLGSGVARPGPTRVCALPSTFQALPSADSRDSVRN